MQTLSPNSPLRPHSSNPNQAQTGISVVIPAYNEENGIGPVLEQLQTLLASTEVPYEILVVDDGSRDATAEIIERYPDITLIRHTINKGYGAALKTGFRNARYDLICMTDADGTYPNERIFDLVQHWQHTSCDMVVGSRTGAEVSIPLVRRPAKWAIGQLANFVGGQPIPDINSGFRVCRRHSVLPFWDILPNGFSFTTTITLCMMTSNYLVEYVPINYHARIGQSKIKPIRDTLNFIQLILRIGLYFVPLKIFMPLSGAMLAVALAWGLFSYFVLGRFADTTTLLIAMTGVQVAILGLLAELINHRVPSIYRNREGE